METQTALVRSDSAVKLSTVALIHLYISLVIHPRNLEGNNSFRLCKTLQDARFAVLFLICVDHQLLGIQNFLYCLVEFRLTGILCYHSLINLINI